MGLLFALAFAFLFTGAGMTGPSQAIGLSMLGVGVLALAIWARNSRLWALSLPAVLRNRYLEVAPKPGMWRW